MGERAIVTGGARGIGRAIVERLAAEGAAVSIWDLPGAPEVPAAAHATVCDVSDEASVTTAFAASLDALGTVDILIANAGVMIVGEYENFPGSAL